MYFLFFAIAFAISAAFAKQSNSGKVNNLAASHLSGSTHPFAASRLSNVKNLQQKRSITRARKAASPIKKRSYTNSTDTTSLLAFEEFFCTDLCEDLVLGDLVNAGQDFVLCTELCLGEFAEFDESSYSSYSGSSGSTSY
jgi:hypothetical protein